MLVKLSILRQEGSNEPIPWDMFDILICLSLHQLIVGSHILSDIL